MFNNILFDELEMTQRLEKIIHLLYNSSKRIHHMCGSILHVSSYGRHESSCRQNLKKRKFDSISNSESYASIKQSNAGEVESITFHRDTQKQLLEMKTTFHGLKACNASVDQLMLNEGLYLYI